MMAKKPKRPRDAVSNAVRVMRIATGEVEEKLNKRSAPPPRPEAQSAAKRSVPDLTTVDGDERILLVTRRLKETRAARRKSSSQERPSTKGKRY
jgi:hypothetical protein